MAIEFFTGLEGCGSNADVYSLFTTQSGAAYSATGGYNNGKCITIAADYVSKNCSAAATKCAGFHLSGCSTSAYSTTASNHLFRLTVGGSYIRVFNTASGIEVRLDATLLGTVGSGTVINTAFHHVEIKVLSHASAGTFELKLDGVSVGSLSGLNTSGTDITEVLWSNCGGSGKIDNLFIASDWVGEMYSVLCVPTSDSSVQFTPSTGSDNYALVDEAAEDGDTTYVESSTVGHKDLYGFSDIATSGITMKCATLVTVAKKDDAGARTLTPIAKQDATEYDQATYTLTTDYPAVVTSGCFSCLDAAPDTSAWTPTIFNAMTWGFKVEA